MKVKFLVLATLMIFGAAAMKAQTQAPSKSDSTIKYQLLDELFKVIKLEEACRETAQQSANQMLAQNPQISHKKAEVESFYNKYLSYERLKGVMANLYAKYYSTDEIRDLVRFYRSPAGQKFNNTSIQIANDAFMANNAILQANQKELENMINQPNH